MDISKATLDALFTGFKTNFQAGFNGVSPLWQRIATLVPSSTSQNAYPWLGALPGMREWIGDRQIKKFGLHDYAIKNRSWEDTVSVLKDNIEDDQSGTYAPLFEALGAMAAAHPDSLVFQTLAAGFTSICYDGQNFFDTDHPVGGQGVPVTTVSNMQAGAGAPWFLMSTKRSMKPLIFQERRKADKLVRKDKPDDDNVFDRKEFVYGVDGRYNTGYGFWQQCFGSKATLDAANFKAARLALETFKNDNGEPLGLTADLLVVGPSNRDAGEEVIVKERNANGETNTLRNAVELLVAPRLT